MKTRLLSVFIFYYAFAIAQAPNWGWAKKIGGSSYEFSNCITTDNKGNSYVTGSFQSSTISLGSFFLTNAGGSGCSGGCSDIFIVKYDSTGNVLWAKSAGGTGSDAGQSVTTDNNANVYVTGYYASSSITFGSTTLTNAVPGYGDIFVVKYDSSGNVLWAKKAGGTGADGANGISADGIGNIYLTGSFSSPSITFGSFTYTNSNSLNGDFFIAKYDSSGNVLWAKAAHDYYDDIGERVCANANGDVLVTGEFGPGTLIFGNDTLASLYGIDIFVVKYNTSGNVIWAKNIGGVNSEFGFGINQDNNRNIYLAGFSESPSFIFGTDTLTTAGAFIAKYDSSGNALWAREAGGIKDFGVGLNTDSNGNSLITCTYLSPTITFGSYTLTNTSVNNYDVFIVKYDSAGSVLWAKGAGGTDDDWSTAIKADMNGNVYVTGFTLSGNMSFGIYTFTNSGGFDVFVAKLDNTGNATSTIQDPNNLIGNIYPNPSQGIFIIQTFEKKPTIEITNIMSEKVYERKLPSINSPFSIDLSSQPSGVYFLQITTDKGIARKKIVISK